MKVSPGTVENGAELATVPGASPAEATPASGSRPPRPAGGRGGATELGAEWLLAIVTATAGCAGFALANGTAAPFSLAFLFGVIGLVGTAAVFRIGSWEMRAFAVTYGACLLAGGAAQFYADLATGTLQNASDAGTFFEFSSEGLTGDSLDDLRKIINAPLAVLIWQTLYSLVIKLRMPPGPWAGVILNAAVVGCAATMIVAATRQVFGGDNWRLRRVTLLCGSCGMFWLFGAIFVRDCFALLANSMLVWGLLRVLIRGTPGSYILMAVVAGIYWFTMREIRGAATLLLLVFSGVAAAAWLISSRAGVFARILVGSLVAAALIIVVLNAVKVVDILDVGALAADAYIALGTDSAGRDSVGAGLLTSGNPLIRMSAGTLFLHLIPVPLWAGFEFGGSEYRWLKSFQGIYLVMILPLTLVGMLVAFKVGGRRREKNDGALLFLGLIPILVTLLVSATSMETRHHGQFLAAYIILAGVPQPGRRQDAVNLERIRIGWFSIVIAVHMLWLLLKFR